MSAAPEPDVVALVVAAGRGSRFGADRPKQYVPLRGRPVLRYSLERFAAHPRVTAVRAVIHSDDETAYAAAAQGLDLLEPVHGGAARQESVRFGLESLATRAPAAVLIHDGARPFADAALIDRVLDALHSHDGAIPAVPVSDTLKRVSDGRIVETVPRDGLWRAQTPQGFAYATIVEAHRALAGRDLSDDAALAERAGLDVAVVQGTAENIKVTTQDDMARAAGWLDAAAEVRSGQGFDVHRFAETPGPLRLCGVDVAHDRGLAGHSDADVGLHVVVDALLGALAEGDIGSHFPPSDPQWRGADSAVFVRHARDLLAARGATVLNLDVTLICERPKVGPHRAAMTKRIAELLDIDPGRVGVKATTTERLGFTGRREGIAAQAIATLRLPWTTS